MNLWKENERNVMCMKYMIVVGPTNKAVYYEWINGICVCLFVCDMWNQTLTIIRTRHIKMFFVLWCCFVRLCSLIVSVYDKLLSIEDGWNFQPTRSTRFPYFLTRLHPIIYKVKNILAFMDIPCIGTLMIVRVRPYN